MPPPFKADLLKIAADFSQQSAKPTKQEAWARIMRSVHYYPPSAFESAYAFIISEIDKARKTPTVQRPKISYQEAAKVHKAGLDKMAYQAFLKTPYWIAFAKERKANAGGRCECCNAQKPLQIHHLDYKHRGNDHLHPERTIALCDACHRARHRL